MHFGSCDTYVTIVLWRKLRDHGGGGGAMDIHSDTPRNIVAHFGILSLHFVLPGQALCCGLCHFTLWHPIVSLEVTVNAEPSHKGMAAHWGLLQAGHNHAEMHKAPKCMVCYQRFQIGGLPPEVFISALAANRT